MERKGKIKIHRSLSGYLYYTVHALNGIELVRSVEYTNKSAIQYGIESLIRLMNSPVEIIDLENTQ